jgi:uncharacterized hydrophobic protein (TIGR00271 family)
MIHLRLRVPGDLRDQVADLLCDDDTVTNVAVWEGAFRKPAGDLVLADVARENASAVIGALRDLDLHHHGSITIEDIDTILSDEATAAEQVAPGAPDDGVVWVAIENRLRADSRLSWAFVAFLALATLIAGAGRILDQPILIVGAMVVGPEFTPMAAICFALARPRPAMVPRALTTLAIGFVVAVAVATAWWALAYHLFGLFTADQASSGPQTDFIIKPDVWSFLVALVAGAAGVLSLTTAKSGPLVGVFISVTTVPAVGSLAVVLASGVWGEVLDCLAQLGVNMLGILLAGVVTLWVQKLVWRRVARRGLRHGVRPGAGG